MKILYAASEAVPFFKTGGLADVAGSLPPALAECGAEVAVVMPLYQKVKEKYGEQLEFVCYDYVDLAWRQAYCGLFRIRQNGVTWYFVDNEQYFLRPNPYGYDDDAERFGFFSRAVVRMLDHMEFWPDVIHCNDWQTALIPVYLQDDGVREEKYRSIRTALSVHNIEYQGRYGRQTLGDVFGLDEGWANDGTIMMDGDVNLLKAAILCADAVNRSEEYDVQVNFCLNYGGRDEIVHAARAFAADVAEGKYKAEDLTEELLSGYLYSRDVPDPELIIRPSGEKRTSNFLLWQSAYSEYVFMNVLWPDFAPEHLDEAIAEYHRRNRRFGGT